jgi:hypothetical protein
VTDPNASNSPQTIIVHLWVYENGKTSAPFGEFSTPVNGSSLSGSIPVTGWALDDIEVSNIKLYIETTYIGDAIFVEGARPDLDAYYHNLPNSNKAGWGYMLLSNTLPNGGNGAYTLTAKATDIEGNEVILGSKTITIDNAHAVNPFGAIDTPTQGGIVSGKEYVNYGWVLTPMPNSIPADGSTINVYIDGEVQGHPGYNINRTDIAALFPGYANSDGAGGYYYIDTTKLKNGLHTISWTAVDSAGNTDGIGSRYFTVMNNETGSGASTSNTNPVPFQNRALSEQEEMESTEIKELERVEINLADEFGEPGSIKNMASSNYFEGYLIAGNELRELPVGSKLDTGRGIFFWQPGPGFIGEYRLVFTGKDKNGQDIKKNIVINIKPKN